MAACSGDGSNVINTENSCQDLWKKAFVKCFLKVDDEIGGKQGNLEIIAPETVGSTAVVALICSSHIIVSNCGDSRAVLCRGKEAMALSVDHKVRFWYFGLYESRIMKVCCYLQNLKS